jgi:hypothetical protein
MRLKRDYGKNWKVKMKVKIVANNSGNDFYDRYIEEEYEAVKDSGVYYINMIHHTGEISDVTWTNDECIEIRLDEITISLDRYNELLEIEAHIKATEPSDEEIYRKECADGLRYNELKLSQNW